MMQLKEWQDIVSKESESPNRKLFGLIVADHSSDDKPFIYETMKKYKDQWNFLERGYYYG